MKILHVITSLRTGGAEKLMVDLLPRLRDLGNEVELLLFDGTRTPFYEELEQTGIKIHHLSIGGNVYNPLNIFRLRKYLKNYDIIHTHNTACQLFAAICSVLCSVVFTTTEHNTTNRRRDWSWYKPLDRWMYSRYSKVICISDQALTSLEKFHGYHHRNCIIYNGINLNKYLKQITTPQTTEFIITMIAGFRYQKDQDTLIKAMSTLPDNYKLWLVGDGERRNILENLVIELNLTDRVKLLGIRNDVPQILEQSHISVFSSHWEGFGLAAVEGMASGRPLIASDVNGLREIVKDYGILFPHQDANALANEIKSLCENQDKYFQVAQKCQERAKQYDISIMANKYNIIYEKTHVVKRNNSII